MANAQIETDSFETGLDRPAIVLPDAEFDIFQIPVLGKNFFGFRVSNLRFLLPIDVFCEMLDKYQVIRLPDIFSWFHGSRSTPFSVFQPCHS